MIVERIETANLPAATYRTARRLLDVADQRTGAARLTHERMREIVGTDADATVRRHLVELQGAGIIAYRRNSDVQIWFADWEAFNLAKDGDQHGSAVISGDQYTRKVISSDQYTRESEHGSVISGDQYTRKVISTRANRAHTDHLPHTHASAPDLEGRKEDPITTDQILPSIPVAPDEMAQSLALLRAVRVSPAEAKALAESHPFERIRHCVAAWWMNRKSAGGKLENEPGVVVFWLKNWGGKQEPKPFDEREWQRTELYRAHRTPEEVAADEAPPPTPPPITVEVLTRSPTGYLDNDPGWLAVEADPSAGHELAALVEVVAVDGVPLYRLLAADNSRVGWLNERMATRLRKLIASAVGHPVLVEIIGVEA